MNLTTKFQEAKIRAQAFQQNPEGVNSAPTVERPGVGDFRRKPISPTR
jgi:hypothetical protein